MAAYDAVMEDEQPALVVVGTVLQTPRPDTLQVLADVAVVVATDGLIIGVHAAGSPEATSAAASAVEVRRLAATQRLLPGLIDTHLHAPQWPQLGSCLDLPLERWLFDHTFPLEARYADAEFAQRVWDDMVPTLLAHGTTTALYYSSIHEDATVRLASTCLAAGQRAFVGRVAMDHPDGTPPWYRDRNPAGALDASRRSIEAIRALDPSRLVQPMITPRFVPACTDALLGGLGELAASTGVAIQTHCSESDWEHDYVLGRYGHSDATALEHFGLLRPGTVLAHGNHLGHHDFSRIRHADAGVAHCPLSNSYFANAIFPAQRAMASGVKVGLGTDVAGGCHPGLLPQCVNAVTSSRLLEDGVDAARPAGDRGVAGSRLDTVAAFHLATVGGADLLDVPCGLLEPGRMFDAFTVDLGGRTETARNRPAAGLRIWPGIDDDATVFEKIVRLATPADIIAVWVAGRQVAGQR